MFLCVSTSLLIDRMLQHVPRRPQQQCIVGVGVGIFSVLKGRDFSLVAPPHVDPPVIDSSGLTGDQRVTSLQKYVYHFTYGLLIPVVSVPGGEGGAVSMETTSLSPSANQRLKHQCHHPISWTNDV